MFANGRPNICFRHVEELRVVHGELLWSDRHEITKTCGR
jgi:hypothetical protein